jgi:Tol biopolymer transport system component
VFTAPLDFGDLWEISLNHPGQAERLPIGHDASDLDVTVSPAGARMAYVEGVANVNIWRVDLHNASPHSQPLIISSRQQKSPSISPDQTKVAFESNRSGTNELWVCDADGSNAMQLTSFGIRATGTPRWSPDGKTIAFDSRVGGEANIYLIDPNRGVANKLDITNVRGNNLPSWSRDGKWIYFVNGEDVHQPSVWKVSSDGGEAVQIVASPATYPIESPDGSYLYFFRNPTLWRSHLDGSGQEEVAGMPPLKRLGDKWVPYGSGIYFFTNEQNNTALEFFDASTKKTSRITELEGTPPGWMGQLSVSSDGTWLVYPQVEASSSNLMMIENWQ